MRHIALLNSCKSTSVPEKLKEGDFVLSKSELSDTLINKDYPYLAFGTKSGKILVYDIKKQLPKIYCVFTSHEPEFDYLKSTEILEKINCIEWLPKIGMSMNLLTANERTIKYWRLTENDLELYNPDDTEYPCIPQYRKSEVTTLKVKIRKHYQNAHAYFINSLVANNDQESFFSSDDLQINMWNLEYNTSPYVIVDLKPDNLEDLSEIITSLKVKPDSSSIFAYSLSTGKIRICDTRIKSNCDIPINEFFSTPEDDLKFFRDIVTSINDLRFSKDSNKIIARDYMNLIEWDMRFAKESLKKYDVQNKLNSEMCYLYETNSIFDKFQCAWACDDRYLVTGSYGNTIKIFDHNVENAKDSGNLFCLDDSFMSEEDLHIDNTVTPIRIKPCAIVTPNESIGKLMNLTRLILMPDVEYNKMIDRLCLPSQNGGTENHSDTPPSEIRGSKKRKQNIRAEMNSVLVTDNTYLDVTKPILYLASDPRQNSIYIASENRFIACHLSDKNYAQNDDDKNDSSAQNNTRKRKGSP